MLRRTSTEHVFFLFRYLRHEIRFDERFHRPGICQVGGLISVQLFEGRGFLALCGQQVWQRGPTCPNFIFTTVFSSFQGLLLLGILLETMLQFKIRQMGLSQNLELSKCCFSSSCSFKTHPKGQPQKMTHQDVDHWLGRLKV